MEETPYPVILAGGLCAENAAEAVRTVQPYGLDANSRLKDAEGNVDAGKSLAFVQAAQI